MKKKFDAANISLSALLMAGAMLGACHGKKKSPEPTPSKVVDDATLSDRIKPVSDLENLTPSTTGNGDSKPLVSLLTNDQKVFARDVALNLIESEPFIKKCYDDMFVSDKLITVSDEEINNISAAKDNLDTVFTLIDEIKAYPNVFDLSNGHGLAAFIDHKKFSRPELKKMKNKVATVKAIKNITNLFVEYGKKCYDLYSVVSDRNRIEDTNAKLDLDDIFDKAETLRSDLRNRFGSELAWSDSKLPDFLNSKYCPTMKFSKDEPQVASTKSGLELSHTYEFLHILRPARKAGKEEGEAYSWAVRPFNVPMLIYDLPAKLRTNLQISGTTLVKLEPRAIGSGTLGANFDSDKRSFLGLQTFPMTCPYEREEVCQLAGNTVDRQPAGTLHMAARSGVATTRGPIMGHGYTNGNNDGEFPNNLFGHMLEHLFTAAGTVAIDRTAFNGAGLTADIIENCFPNGVINRIDNGGHLNTFRVFVSLFSGFHSSTNCALNLKIEKSGAEASTNDITNIHLNKSYFLKLLEAAINDRTNDFIGMLKENVENSTGQKLFVVYKESAWDSMKTEVVKLLEGGTTAGTAQLHADGAKAMMDALKDRLKTATDPFIRHLGLVMLEMVSIKNHANDDPAAGPATPGKFCIRLNGNDIEATTKTGGLPVDEAKKMFDDYIAKEVRDKCVYMENSDGTYSATPVTNELMKMVKELARCVKSYNSNQNVTYKSIESIFPEFKIKPGVFDVLVDRGERLDNVLSALIAVKEIAQDKGLDKPMTVDSFPNSEIDKLPQKTKQMIAKLREKYKKRINKSNPNGSNS